MACVVKLCIELRESYPCSTHSWSRLSNPLMKLLMRLTILALLLNLFFAGEGIGAERSGASAPNAHANAVHVIFPYLDKGHWVFDDDRFGLTREPFVLGADRVIALLSASVPTGPDKRFKLIFSARPLPDPTLVADRVGQWSQKGGAYYDTRPDRKRFWLCPALFHYFATAPDTIYARAEALR